MGGSQSTRQVTLVNKDDKIMLTDDVKRRLLGLKEREIADQQPPVSEADVEAIKQQIENEYRERITEVSTQSHKIKADEFARAVQEVEAKFIQQTGSPVCQELQQQVFECYQDNLHKPLYCSKQVKAFTEAVEKARQNALMSRKS